MIPSSVTDAWSPEGLRTQYAGIDVSRWLSTDNEETYQPKGNRYRPDSFDYRLNSRGFRCVELEPTNEPRVIYIGCSLTMGVGLPEYEIWPHLTHAHLTNALGPMPYWNLACSGKSVGWVARMLTIAIPLLRPHVVVALLPVASRREVWINDNISAFVPNSTYISEEFIDLVAELYPPPMQFFDMIRNLSLMTAVCRSYGTKLLWDTWDRRIFDPDHVTPMPEEIRSSWTSLGFNFDLSPRNARDRIHTGHETHSACASRIFPKILQSLREVL